MFASSQRWDTPTESLRPTTMNRSAHGCWTCRLRHVKCDETSPVCRTCSTRDIPCHGYGEKPDWMDGGVLEHSKTAEVRSAIKANLMRAKQRKSSRRKILSPSLSEYPGRPTESATSPCPQSDTPASPPGSPYIYDDQATSTPRSSSILASEEAATSTVLENSTFASGFATSIQRPTVSVQSSRCSPETNFTVREVELLLYYLDYVFPLEYRYSETTLSFKTKSWLVWLLLRSGPLRHAILTLAALHQNAMLGQDIGDGYAQLTGHHAQTLKDLQVLLQHTQDHTPQDSVGQQIEILACGVSLISFEVRKCS